MLWEKQTCGYIIVVQDSSFYNKSLQDAREEKKGVGHFSWQSWEDSVGGGDDDDVRAGYLRKKRQFL